MTADRPTESPSSPASATASRARSWRLTAWIAGVFTVLVGVGMVAAHLRHKASDPWRSPVLLDLKEQLRADPKNEPLKQQIRALDLGLRERYFSLLSLKASGVYLLLGGTLVCLYSCGRVRRLNRQPHTPETDPQAAGRPARHARWSRFSVGACGVLALAALSVVAFTVHRSPLEDPEVLAQLLDETPETGPLDDTVSADQLRSNWPRFRGDAGSGVATAGPDLASAPMTIWQTPNPAPGFNSPIVWENRLLFTGGDAGKREVFCVNITTGELMWGHDVNVANPRAAESPSIPDMTGYAASTAATDGQRVYAIFATGELVALDLEGRPVWSKHLGPLDNPYGHAGSLATWQNTVIVQLDQGDEESRQSRIMAFDGPTGDLAWQKARLVGASWSTPIIVEAAGRPQLIAVGLPWVISYAPDEGTELWRARLLEGEITPSPVMADGLLIVVDPGMYQLLALQPDGTGDITGTQPVWRVDGDMPDITSPVGTGDRVFTLASDGTLTCFETGSGTEVWKASVEAGSDFQASPSLVGGVLVLLSTAGDMIGIEAGGEYRELWRLKLEDEFYASPAFAGGRMYLRGTAHLWCLSDSGGERAQP